MEASDKCDFFCVELLQKLQCQLLQHHKDKKDIDNQSMYTRVVFFLKNQSAKYDVVT